MTYVYEPPARQHHAAVTMGPYVFVWAGTDRSSSYVESSVVECFDVTSISWQQPRQLCNQALPVGYRNMGVAWDGKNAYLCGGYFLSNGLEERSNKLYEVNMSSLQCRELVPATSVAPTAKSSSRLVCVNRILVSYGGYTGRTASNELFVFDLNMSECTHSYMKCPTSPNKWVITSLSNAPVLPTGPKGKCFASYIHGCKKSTDITDVRSFIDTCNVVTY